MYFSSRDMQSSVSISKEEPIDMSINRDSSLSELRPQPSEIFVGIDTAARCICDISPNVSDLGYLAVKLYMSFTKQIDFCQTIKSRNL